MGKKFIFAAIMREVIPVCGSVVSIFAPPEVNRQVTAARLFCAVAVIIAFCGGAVLPNIWKYVTEHWALLC